MKRVPLIVTLALGCSAGPGTGNPFATGSGGTGGTSVDPSANASAGSTGGDDASASAASDPSETSASDEIFDVGDADSAPGTAEGGDQDGCQKIDFVFAIDNSGSMGAHQETLAASFGPFIDTIFDTVQAQDYRIMVVDSDADRDLASCGPCPYDECADFCDVEDALPECEGILGAGEIQPYNPGASNRDCGVPGSDRWLNSDLPPADLRELFACIALVGRSGSGGEKPVTAAVEAVTTQNAAGGCNESFLRDDAVLVVTFISDDYPSSNDDDAHTFGTVDGWYDALVAAKGGQAENVVMLGIMNLEGSDCVQEGSAGPGPLVQPTQKFVDFVEKFSDRGVIGDVCAQPDYDAFFEQAVSVIDTACDEFTPEG